MLLYKIIINNCFHTLISSFILAKALAGTTGPKKSTWSRLSQQHHFMNLQFNLNDHNENNACDFEAQQDFIDLVQLQNE